MGAAALLHESISAGGVSPRPPVAAAVAADPAATDKARQILGLLGDFRIAPGTICEIGCGAGELLLGLHAQLPETVTLHGYETSSRACSQWRGRLRPRLYFHLQDMLEEEGIRFDMVLALNSLRQAGDVRQFLARLHGRGRHVVLQIPLESSLRALLRRRLKPGAAPPDRPPAWSRAGALALIREAGFRVLDTRYSETGPGPGRSGFIASRLRRVVRLAHALYPDLSVRLFGGYSLLVLARSA